MIFPNNKVSVCILTSNRIDYLKKTVRSVLNSTFKDFRIFVFNDMSTDGTDLYLEDLQKKGFLHEFRNKSKSGIYGNANLILENIKSEYCIMLHDDDLLEKGYISEVVGLADSDDSISFVGTGWNIINGDDVVIETRVFPEINKAVILSDKEYFYHNLDGLCFPWSGTLIRMSCINGARFEPAKYNIASDTVFLNKLAIKNRVGYIPRPLFNYRIHKDQATRKMDFDTYFDDWKRLWSFYDDLISSRFNNDKTMSIKHRTALNRTISFLMIIAPDLKSFFKILFSKYTDLFLMKPGQIRSIISKLIKLIVRKE
jgi:glycosyltransferase involved in cell wall biosynthesis